MSLKRSVQRAERALLWPSLCENKVSAILHRPVVKRNSSAEEALLERPILIGQRSFYYSTTASSKSNSLAIHRPTLKRNTSAVKRQTLTLVSSMHRGWAFRCSSIIAFTLEANIGLANQKLNPTLVGKKSRGLRWGAWLRSTRD